jgi:hypothetical protein
MDRASNSVESALVAWSAEMVAAQAGCDLDEAILRMQEHGVRTRRTLEEVAAAVLERRIRFDPKAPS